jgi:hypothetical protein
MLPRRNAAGAGLVRCTHRAALDVSLEIKDRRYPDSRSSVDERSRLEGELKTAIGSIGPWHSGQAERTGRLGIPARAGSAK